MMVPASYLILLGKVFLAVYFFTAAIIDIKLWKSSIQLLKKKHFPLPTIGLILAILLKIACSIGLFLDDYLPYAALGLIFFTLVCNFIFNAFWQASGEEKLITLLRFLANLAIIGGFCLLLAVHPA